MSMVLRQPSPSLHLEDTVKIRREETLDHEGVREVNCAAFPSDAEANVVDAVRSSAQGVISLVAEEDKVVGHIMFSPVMLDTDPVLKIAGLAPMAVLPSVQKQGIGKALVRAGLEACKDDGYGAVVVLGHAEYYPKFGFVTASDFGIRWEHGHDDAFMVLELKPGYLKNAAGTVKYDAAFDGV